MLELSIVIPVFNGLAWTQACLKSLEETVGTRSDFEVLVVDNASTDGTPEWLATLPEPRYRVLRQSTNLGYARANNAAARLAMGRRLLLLNNDTVLLPGWLEPMLRVLRSAPKAGLVGNVQREAATGLIDHTGILFTLAGEPQHVGKDAVSPPSGEFQRFPAVTAACCLLPRDLFLRLDGFSEEFKNGFEDIDLCLRIRAEGFRIYVANRSVIYHHVGASVGRHEHETQNADRFRARWGETIASLAEPRRHREHARRDGWRYLRENARRPWQFDAGRFRQAVAAVVAPRPQTRSDLGVEPFFFE